MEMQIAKPGGGVDLREKIVIDRVLCLNRSASPTYDSSTLSTRLSEDRTLTAEKGESAIIDANILLSIYLLTKLTTVTASKKQKPQARYDLLSCLPSAKHQNVTSLVSQFSAGTSKIATCLLILC
jgi:hypothetical protein